MAILKQKTNRGIVAEYHAIIATGYLKSTNTTSVSLGAYVSKEVRQEDVNNYIPEMTESFSFDGELTRDEIYPLIMASKMEKRIITPAKEAVLDEGGNVIEEAVEEVSEMIETNPWASGQVV